MVNKKNIFITFILFFLFVPGLFAQPKSGNREIKIPKINFVLLLDSIPKIPSSSEEAFSYIELDSANEFVRFDSTIEKLNVRIKLLTEQFSQNNFPKQRIMKNPQIPSGGPPQGGMGPPGSMDLPEGFSDIREDLDEVNSAMDKINVIKEKYKSDIRDLQEKANSDLHQTFENDYTAHLEIIDDFLLNASRLNLQCSMMIKENLKKIDDIEKKYDYGAKIKSMMFQSEFIELQVFQTEIVNYLFGITKEFIVLGGKFYNKKNRSLE